MPRHRRMGRPSEGQESLVEALEASIQGASEVPASETTRGRAEFVLGDGAREMWVSWSEEAPVAEVLSLLFNSMLAWAARKALTASSGVSALANKNPR